jgi:alpha,alpha-trehalase
LHNTPRDPLLYPVPSESEDLDVDMHLVAPSALFPGLFEAVADSQLVEVPKDWADVRWKADPVHILSAYEREQPMDRRAMSAFVDRYFEMPSGVSAAETALSLDSPASGLVAHIRGLWTKLSRPGDPSTVASSLIPLPYPYVIPGGMFREVYYWDTYFTALGLHAERPDIVEGLVGNLAHLLRRFGRIPNGNRSYFLSRSQPPFFFALVGLLNGSDAGMAYGEHLQDLLFEHAFWMASGAKCRTVAMSCGAILNRYWDDQECPRDESFVRDRETARRSGRESAAVYRSIRAAAESGWDFSSRWFDDCQHMETIRTTDIVPIDLNCILFGLESAIAEGAKRTGQTHLTEQYSALSESRRKAVSRHLWHEECGYFCDYDNQRRIVRPQLTAATLYPLFFGVATPEQARRVAQATEQQLLQTGGVVSTLCQTGEQWDWPNGWAPLQWIAIAGLEQYGHTTLARTIARRWLTTVNGVFQTTRTCVEKYDVVECRPGGGGEYPLQDGFGWTNGVTLALIRRYPDIARSVGIEME